MFHLIQSTSLQAPQKQGVCVTIGIWYTHTLNILQESLAQSTLKIKYKNNCLGGHYYAVKCLAQEGHLACPLAFFRGIVSTSI